MRIFRIGLSWNKFDTFYPFSDMRRASDGAAALCKNNSDCPAPRRRGSAAHGGIERGMGARYFRF